MTIHETRVLISMVVLCVTGIANAENPKDFTVESPTHNKTFRLSEHRRQLVAVHFLLKTECPYCLKYTHDYARLGATNPEVIHLFLKPDSVDEIKSWSAKIGQEDLKEAPVIYRDPDAKLAKEFRIPDGYKFHGQFVHYPAVVVITGSGKEVFRYEGKSNSDRLKPEEFIERLKSVVAKDPD